MTVANSNTMACNSMQSSLGPTLAPLFGMLVQCTTTAPRPPCMALSLPMSLLYLQSPVYFSPFTAIGVPSLTIWSCKFASLPFSAVNPTRSSVK